MKKISIFLFLLSNFISFLNASEQLIVVIADNFNTPTAQLKCFQKQDARYVQTGETIAVNLGRNGLGWGIGEQKIDHSQEDPIKHEGDGKAPAGIFTLGSVFGYADAQESKMPYLQASADLICIDDSRSKYYNQLIKIRSDIAINSFEWMLRQDRLYEIGLNIHHNTQAIAYRGSCIFLHVEKAPGSATSGCTSMAYDHLEALLSWLDPHAEPLLIQIPSSYCSKIEQHYPGICAE